MSDITANVVVSMPSQLFTMARSFKAVANGKIYIGKIDTDPVNPENQIQVYVENEDGSHVPVSQPIIINAAGYPVYNGQIAKFVTGQGHSMAVYDAYGAQQFYFPNVLKYDPDQFGPDFKDQLAQDGSYINDDTKGDALIGVHLPAIGAIHRTQHDKNQDFITPQDFGVKMDGTDSTDAINAFVEYVNAIPNTDGIPVGVLFPPGIISYSKDMHFTRPVNIHCNGTVFHYNGSGDAFHLGPDDLGPDYNAATGKTPFHKCYSIEGAVFEGGTTSGNAISFAHWVPDCRVFRCEFRAFGGDGSWAIRAEFNNWLVTVSQCVFWGHTDYRQDEVNTRNFLNARGYRDDPTYYKVNDQWSTRVQALDNRLFGTGWRRAGTAYLLSGWKCRVIGGSCEGFLDDIILSGGCNEIEINGFYTEKNFSGDSGEVPVTIRISYPGDPFITAGYADTLSGVVPTSASAWIKRLTVKNCYFNLHNTEHDARFILFSSNLTLEQFHIDSTSFVHSTHELVGAPEIPGHRDWYIGDIRFDGDNAITNRLIESSFASMYKPSYKSRAINLIKNGSAENIKSGYTGTAPINTNFGTSGISATSDGSGGSYVLTKIATGNTSDRGYERNRLDMNSAAYQLICTTAASGQTFLQIQWDTSISPIGIQGVTACFSFYAKAYNSSVILNGFLLSSISAVNTQSANTAVVAVGDWFKYSLNFTPAVSMPLGAAVTSSEIVRVSVALPAGTVFAVDIASPVLTIGEVAYPLYACM
ncbi:phage head-binding domain-containing protein [Escherichia fergusonii]|uniref:phage head-binding domain-containing protein n=2 Tax=Escherichia TaxID=561 RepID=UPI001CD109AE|nr:phage head-binding domain-containing protein [Escherichia fergusonii]